MKHVFSLGKKRICSGLLWFIDEITEAIYKEYCEIAKDNEIMESKIRDNKDRFSAALTEIRERISDE